MRNEKIYPRLIIRGRMARPSLHIDRYKITHNWYPIDRPVYRDVTPEMLSWLDESLAGTWYPISNMIYFSNEEDLVLFKMIWL